MREPTRPPGGPKPAPSPASHPRQRAALSEAESRMLSHLKKYVETVVSEMLRRIDALEQVNRDRLEVAQARATETAWELADEPPIRRGVRPQPPPPKETRDGDIPPRRKKFSVAECPNCANLIEGPMSDHFRFCPDQKVS